MYNTRPFEFYIPPTATTSVVRIHKEASNSTYIRNVNYAPSHHINISENYLKQEIKKLNKELQMHPRRIDIKIKIMKLQKELKKYIKNKRK